MKKTTLTNIKLIGAANALQVLCQQEQALNPKFRLTKNKKSLEPHAIQYQEFRNNILDEFGSKDENGQLKLNENRFVVFPTPEANTAATAKIGELDQITVEVEYQPIIINSVTAQGVDQSVLEALLWMFEEPE